MSSIISGITNLYSTGTTTKLKIESISPEVETNGTQTTSEDQGVSSKYDTLELSQDYLSYKTQSENSTLSDETSLLNSQTGDIPPPPPPPRPPQGMSSGSTSEDADSTINTL